MKCNFCGKEIKDEYCPYCGQTQKILEENSTPKVVMALNTTLVISYLTLIIAILSSFIIYFAVATIGLVILLIIMCTKKIKTGLILKKTYILVLIVSIVSLLIVLVPSVEYVKTEYDRHNYCDKYEEITGIVLPDKYASNYKYEIGYDSDIRVYYYESELTKPEYSSLAYNYDWKIDNGDNHYLNQIKASHKGYYLIYNITTNKLETPTDKIEFQYVIIELVQQTGYFGLRIYDVMSRSY